MYLIIYLHIHRHIWRALGPLCAQITESKASSVCCSAAWLLFLLLFSIFITSVGCRYQFGFA